MEMTAAQAKVSSSTSGGEGGFHVLSNFLEAQRLRKRGEKQTPGEMIRQNKVERSNEISATTQLSFAESLAREVMAIESVGGDPAEKWQKLLTEVVQAKFPDTHDADYKPEDMGKIFDSYVSLFDDLLGSENKDTARQWATAGLLVNKRQMLALQVGTGAYFDVKHAGEKSAHVAEPRAVSPTLGTSGEPLDAEVAASGSWRLAQALTKAGVAESWSLIGGAAGKLASGGDNLSMGLGMLIGNLAPDRIAGLIKFVAHMKPGTKINWEDMDQIKAMRDAYTAEGRKRLHSTGEVKFFKDDAENLIKQPGSINVYTDAAGRPATLDPVQEAYLNQMTQIATATGRSEATTTIQDQASSELNQLVDARVDGMQKLYGQELVSQLEINLVHRNAGNEIVVNTPGEAVIMLPGDPTTMELPVGFDHLNTIHLQLAAVMMKIHEGVNEEVLGKQIGSAHKDKVEAALKAAKAKTNPKMPDSLEVKEKEEYDLKLKQSEAEETRFEEITEYKGIDGEIAENAARKKNLDDELADIDAIKSGCLAAKEEDVHDKITAITKENQKKKMAESKKASLEKEMSETIPNMRKMLSNVAVLYGQIANARTDIQAIVDAKNARTPPNFEGSELSDMRSLEKTRDDAIRQKNKEDADMAAYFGTNPHTETTLIDRKSEIMTTDMPDAIDAIAAVEKSIRVLEREKADLETEVKALENRVATSKAKIEERDQLEVDAKELASRKTYLAAKYKPDFDAEGGNFDKMLENVQGQITTLEAEIDKILNNPNIADNVQVEILQAAQEHIFSKAKWGEIMSRGARRHDLQADIQALGNDESNSDFALALRARPGINPAYLRMIKVIGGPGVFGANTERFDALTKLITAEDFMAVYKKNTDRQAALAITLGVPTIPSQIGLASADLADPDVQIHMLGNIDKVFIRDMMKYLGDKANDGTLGLSKDERKLFIELEQAEKAMERSGKSTDMSDEIEELQNVRRENLRGLGHTAGYRDSLLVSSMVTEFTLDPAHVGDVFEAVATVMDDDAVSSVVANFNRYAVAPGQFTGRLRTRLMTGVITADASLIAITEPQCINLVNKILNTRLGKDEAQAAQVLPEHITHLDTIFTPVGGVPNLAHTREALLQISVFTDQIKNNIPTSNSDLGKKITFNGIEKTLRTHLKDIIRNVDPTLTIGGNSRDAEMVAILKSLVAEQTQNEKWLQVVDIATSNFMEFGGTLREAIWLNSVCMLGEKKFASLVADAVQDVRSAKKKVTIDLVLEYIPDKKMADKMGDILAMIKDDAATLQGVADADDEVALPTNNLAGIIPAIYGRMMAEGKPTPPVPVTRLDNDEITLCAKQLEKYIAKMFADEATRSRIADLSFNYPHLSGPRLVTAIEGAIGGASKRDEAIKLAGAVAAFREQS